MKEVIQHVQLELLLLVVTPELPITRKKGVKSDANKFYFCLTESLQKRKELVDRLVDDGQYSRDMVLRAVNRLRDEDSAREWLLKNGLPLR